MGRRRIFRDALRNCAGCSAEFAPSHGVQRFCGKTCADESLRVQHQARCTWCGGQFEPKEANRSTFCTREHAFEAKRAAAESRRVERLEAVASLAFLLPTLPARPARRFSCACRICGAAFSSPVATSNQCSEPCRMEAARRAGRAAVESRPLQGLTCGWCTGEFWVRKHRDRRFCSEACTRAAAGSARRARLRGAQFREHVAMGVLLMRDRGLCHLCGMTVRTDVGIQHPMAPTRDHVVPVSEGGEHSYSNVKLAHRICNSRRGVAPVAA